MPNAKRSSYRGYCITTRCADLQLTGRRPWKGFDAAFAISPMDPDGESWQEFLKTIFSTCEAAQANALGAARRSIDDDIAAVLRRRPLPA